MGLRFRSRYKYEFFGIDNLAFVNYTIKQKRHSLLVRAVSKIRLATFVQLI